MQQIELKHRFMQQDPRQALIEESRMAVMDGRTWAARVAIETPQRALPSPDAEAFTDFASRAATRDLLDDAAPTEARRLVVSLSCAIAALPDDGSDAAYRERGLLRAHAEALTALADRLDGALDLRSAILAAGDTR